MSSRKREGLSDGFSSIRITRSIFRGPKAWRRRGVGLALLRHTFREFHLRGDTHVGLGVDAENPTGATRLYERAGMRVINELVLYEKELG